MAVVTVMVAIVVVGVSPGVMASSRVAMPVVRDLGVDPVVMPIGP